MSVRSSRLHARTALQNYTKIPARTSPLKCHCHNIAYKRTVTMQLFIQ